MNRILELRNRLKLSSLDAIIVSAPANIYYFTDFLNPEAYLLITHKETIYFTDSRYILDARRRLCKKARVALINGSVFEMLAKECVNLSLNKVAFEERHLPYAEYKKIKDCLKGTSYLVPVHGIVEGMRRCKDPQEIEKIRKAASIAALAIKSVQEFIRPGVSELEICAELERFMRYNGAMDSSFDIIAACGKNSSFPHHLSSAKRLSKNDILLIDAGADYSGYKSDLTRVYFLGKINILARRIYSIVLKAQSLAISKIRPGVKVSFIDNLSRNYIASKGYGKYFLHSLGHGTGLEIHEYPSISPKSDAVLEEGMIFTVEPAIYLPGKFGIRIEDMVLVTRKGCEVLSGSIDK